MQSLAVTGGDDHAHTEDDNPNHEDTVMVGACCQWRAHSLVTISKAGPMVVAVWVCGAGGWEAPCKEFHSVAQNGLIGGSETRANERGQESLVLLGP